MKLLVGGMVVCAGLLAGGARAAEGDARFYFGHIEAPCHPSKVTNKATCDGLFDAIRALGADCPNIDAPCPSGEKVLKKLFGDTFRNTLPDFMLYLEHEKDAQGNPSPGRFVARQPILMWNNRNTPHIFGARDIYALVFSERKVCIDGTVVTEYKNEPNPFSFLLTVLGKSFSNEKVKDDEREPIEFSWHPLSGDPQNPGMWYAVARAGIAANSTNRIVVRYRAPQTKPPAKDKEKPAALPEECDPEKQPKAYSADFLAANGFFSNSSESKVTVALALGVTLNAKDTSIASGGSDVAYNGYALVKFYPLDRFRPRVHAGDRDFGAARPSFGLVVGTNILNNAFDELLLGASIGHLWANVGVTVGINSIEGKKDTDQGRKERLFLGLDYSF